MSKTALKVAGGVMILAGVGVAAPIMYRLLVTTKVPPLPPRPKVVVDPAMRLALDTATAKASAAQNQAAAAETQAGRPAISKRSPLDDL
jgi:hypothetical protein